MIEFIVGAVIVISIVVYLIANRKTESENKEINSTYSETLIYFKDEYIKFMNKI